MKILICGGSGQLAQALLKTLSSQGSVLALSHAQLNISDSAGVSRCFARTKPDVLINAAAYTAVDDAETNKEQAFEVNARGAHTLATQAARSKCRFIQVSTDFVFGGSKTEPYTSSDMTGPLNVYGQSKLEGEELVSDALGGEALILRTSWLYSQFGRNFFTNVLRLLRSGQSLRFVSDQVGSPTWAMSLAAAIRVLLSKPEMRGIHHWADCGTASRYEFAVAIHDEAMGLGLITRPVIISPGSDQESPAAAKRPSYSVLDATSTRAALGLEAVHWRNNLRAMLGEIRRDT